MAVRIAALIPVLLSVAAFILSLLIMLSGKDPNFLGDVFVLRINTTDIGKNIDMDSLLSRVGVDPNQPYVSTFTQRIEEAGLQVGQILNTLAHEVGLHDLYTTHILSWCEGTVLVDHSTKTTTCTKPHFPFSFNPITILETELLQGLTLKDLGVPTENIDGAVRALETAYKAMSICYLVGVILSGLSIFTGLVSMYPSRVIEFLNSILVMLGVIALGVASAIGTVIAISLRNEFNSRVNDTVGVKAYSSTKYLGMTWASVTAMLLASLLWCGLCCCGRHNRTVGYNHRNTKYGYGEKERAQRWSFRRKV